MDKPELSNIAELRDRIRKAGLRSTSARVAVLQNLETATSPLSHADLATALAPLGFDKATVYRNLKALVDDGTLAVVQLPGENPRYEPVSRRHHHHFQCTFCKRVFDVHECPGNLARLAPKGFTVEHHELTLYGRCDGC